MYRHKVKQRLQLCLAYLSKYLASTEILGRV